MHRKVVAENVVMIVRCARGTCKSGSGYFTEISDSIIDSEKNVHRFKRQVTFEL